MNESNKENKKISEPERDWRSYKRFNITALDELNRDFLEEICEKKPNMNSAIDELCDMARKNIEKTEASPETVLLPPDCGWCIFDPEEGDVCIFGMRKPVRRVLMKWRKLKYFRCDLCEVLDIKRAEEELRKEAIVANPKLLLEKLPYKIELGTSYNVSRDLVLFVYKFRTMSPSKLAEEILKIKGVQMTPESITNWFRRHPEVKKGLETDLEILGDISEEEIREKVTRMENLERHRKNAKPAKMESEV